MGTGKSLADAHWLALDLSDIETCKGVYRIVETTRNSDPTLLDINVALDCGGKTGGGVTALFKFVRDGQILGGCSLWSHNAYGNFGNYYLVCGPSQHAADKCAKSAIDELVAMIPHGSLSVPTFVFHPK